MACCSNGLETLIFEILDLKLVYTQVSGLYDNLKIFRNNIEQISELNFSTDFLNKFKQKIIEYLLSEDFLNEQKISSDSFNKKYEEIINIINTNAPVKIISLNKSDNEMIDMFNDIIKEIKKIDLKRKIESLEDEVSLNLDEKRYSELLSLRNQLKGG